MTSHDPTDPSFADPNLADPTPSGAPDMSAYLGLFLDEGGEQLAILESEVLAMERGETTPELLGALFRAAHTIKGSSRAMGFARIGNLTHELENVLDDLRNGTLAPNSAILDALLDGADALKSLMAIVAAHGSDAGGEDFTALIARLDALRRGGASSPTPAQDAQAARATGFAWTLGEFDRSVVAEAVSANQRVLTVSVGFADGCAMRSVRAFQALAELAPLGAVLKTQPAESDLADDGFDGDLHLLLATEREDEELRRTLLAISEVTEARLKPFAPEESPTVAVPATVPTATEAPKPTERAAEAAPAAQTIRVGLDRLDALLNLVGELVIDRTQIARMVGDLHARYGGGDERFSELVEAMGRLSRISSELQDEVMKTRTLPLDGVFARLPRMVRDVAAKTGKQIEFVVTGGETELDRLVLETLGDPLIHILRNSVDHGVEPPEERLAMGKPAAGTVTLSARYEGSEIVIEISDDGRGIDPVAIRAAAVRKGIVTEVAAELMSDREAIALIMAPGFSTAATLSEISGRGVGMDIVRSNIDRIGGRLLIESRVGFGTTFTMHLPLTLAILRALLVEVEGETCVLPLASVVEIRSLAACEADLALTTIAGQAVAVLRGETIPAAGLWDVLAANPHAGDPARVARHSHLVVVRQNERSVALGVDSIAGEQEVVIKPIGALLSDLRGISGGSILGDGRVALIVDVASAIGDVRAGARREATHV